MRSAVLQFPGSNCDEDAVKAIAQITGAPADLVWHTAADLSEYDLIIVPGGFSYGDYLRSGAIARFAPAMAGVARAAQQGVYVLGICNGFQILTEAGLLPGALRKNESLQYRCEIVPLIVANADTAFTRTYTAGEVIHIPIAHGDGNYYVDDATLAQMEARGQIIFRYAKEHNPNGSVADIAGIINEQGNVLGMMPHPERAMHDLLGSADGARLFASILTTWRDAHEHAHA